MASRPRVFTKVMVVVAAHLRTRGVIIFPYIDNWLIVAKSRELLRDHVHLTLSVLRLLGLQVNVAKSALDPSQRLRFIGAILDTTVCRAFLPPDRAQVLKDTALHFSRVNEVSAQEVQRLLGLMAATLAVITFARLRMRTLQLWFLRVFNPLRHQ